MEKFSILTACYNGAPFIQDWLQSLILQTDKNFEVLVVDDNSTDNSLDILNEIKNKKIIDLKILSNKKRQYYSNVLKQCYEMSSSNYLGILDIDDKLKPHSISLIKNCYIQNPDIGYIYTQFDIFDSTFSSFKKTGFSCIPKNNVSLLDLGKKKIHGMSHWRTFSKRVKNIDKIFKKDLRCAVDKYMAYRLEENAIGMFVDVSCYDYRTGIKNTISHTESSVATWKEIMKEAENRRKKYGLAHYPIIKWYKK